MLVVWDCPVSESGLGLLLLPSQGHDVVRGSTGSYLILMIAMGIWIDADAMIDERYMTGRRWIDDDGGFDRWI